MKRRAFLAAFAASLTAQSVIARAPNSGKTHILAEGYLTADNELGYALGNNLQLNAREKSPQAKLLAELDGQRLVLFAQPLKEGA